MAILLVWSNLPGVVNAADGDLDLTFDTDGLQTTGTGATSDFGNAVVVQPDGKIVVAGRSGFPAFEFMTNSDFAVVRYNADGSLDNTFDGDGIVVTNINDDDEAYGVALQPDGKIVIAGRTGIRRGLIGVPGGPVSFAVLRYNADGSLDNTFDGDGIVTTDINGNTFSEAYALAIQSDGNIVVAGYTLSMGTGRDFGVARYTSNGSLDATFDTDGMVATDLPLSNDIARGVALQQDGRIVVAGTSSALSSDFGVVRYNTDGSLDTTFDTDGIMTTDFNGGPDTGRGVAIQADGKIVVAGSASIPLPPSPFSPPSFTRDFGLVRYNDDGSLDMSFDSDGRVTTNFANRLDEGYDVAIQQDGKIVAAGSAQLSVFETDFGLTRYNPDGSLDTSFGGDGIVTTDFKTGSNNLDEALAIAIQPDNKIVAAGYGVPQSESVFRIAVARYEASICELTCPDNIIVSNDPGQCGAIVTFATTDNGACGVVTCVPASGSFFPVGTTTVTCTPTIGAGCSFTITVNDTEAPTIDCPDDVTVTTGGGTSVVVNYTTPTGDDNCGVASVVCNPPSGSVFPLGTGTVTCTVTDTSGNTAACSFNVSVFDVCIEDNNDPSRVLLFISTGPLAGTYQICCGGITLEGVGTISNKRGVLNLTHFTTDRRVQGYLYPTNQGSASLQSPPSAFPCIISDSNVTNNGNCTCPTVVMKTGK